LTGFLNLKRADALTSRCLQERCSEKWLLYLCLGIGDPRANGVQLGRFCINSGIWARYPIGVHGIISEVLVYFFVKRDRTKPIFQNNSSKGTWIICLLRRKRFLWHRQLFTGFVYMEELIKFSPNKYIEFHAVCTSATAQRPAHSNEPFQVHCYCSGLYEVGVVMSS
jgi:hypothetical protein